MSKPIRHQRSRQKGARLPDGVVCVTRPGKWGNPFATAGEFRALLESLLGVGEPDANCVNVEQFARSVTSEQLDRMHTMARHLHKLRGKDLACWCGLNEECHGDVLIELANRRICSQ